MAPWSSPLAVAPSLAGPEGPNLGSRSSRRSPAQDGGMRIRGGIRLGFSGRVAMRFVGRGWTFLVFFVLVC